MARLLVQQKIAKAMKELGSDKTGDGDDNLAPGHMVCKLDLT